MNKLQAQDLVETHIDKTQVAIVEESTKEFESCFVFYFQSRQYLASDSFSDMVVGQGPILVCKQTGSLHETGSAFSTEHYVKVFEACSDPFAELTDSIIVSGWHKGVNKIEATKLIKTTSGMGLKQSKEVVDNALGNKASTFSAGSAAIAKEAVIKLETLGFKCRQLWSNQLP